MAEHRIFIRHEPFGAGFDVTVDPPLDGENLDREYQGHRDAFGYAVGLRMSRGWPVVDLASGAGLDDVLGGRRR